MIVLIAFVAAFHLALGYALAIYLGYAPTSQRATGDTTHSHFNCEAPQPPALSKIVAASHSDDTLGSRPADAAIAEVVTENGQSTAEANDTGTAPPPIEIAESDDETNVEENVLAELSRLLDASSNFLEKLGTNSEVVFAETTNDAPHHEIAAKIAASARELQQEIASSNSTPSSGPNWRKIQLAREELDRRAAVISESAHGATDGPSDGRNAIRSISIEAHEAAFAMRNALAAVQFDLLETAGADHSGWMQGALGGDNFSRRARLASKYAELREHAEEGKLVGVVLDIDRCQRLNTTIGPPACEKVIEYVGELARSIIGDKGICERVSGQRFVAVLHGLMPNEATDLVEVIRESFQETTFAGRELEFTATISCSLAEATAGESLGALVQRAQDAIAEAKRYGRNRTFLHDGKCPMPIVPPMVEVESRRVSLTA